MNDELGDAYDAASKIYEKYVDRTKEYLWELQDARDDDIANFITNIDRQETYFGLYSGWLVDAENDAELLRLTIKNLQ